MMKLLSVIGMSLCLLSTGLQAEVTLQPQQILNAHNKIRFAQGLPLLDWSDSLENAADNRTQRLRADRCVVKEPQAGENIFTEKAVKIETDKDDSGASLWHTQVQFVTDEQVVESWAKEANWYDPATQQCAAPPGKGCNNYVQIIQANINAIGCSAVACLDQSQAWVCMYGTAGK